MTVKATRTRTNPTLKEVLSLITKPNPLTNDTWFTREDVALIKTNLSPTAISRAFRTIEADPSKYLVVVGTAENTKGSTVAAIKWEYTSISEVDLAQQKALFKLNQLAERVRSCKTAKDVEAVMSVTVAAPVELEPSGHLLGLRKQFTKLYFKYSIRCTDHHDYKRVEMAHSDIDSADHNDLVVLIEGMKAGIKISRLSDERRDAFTTLGLPFNAPELEVIEAAQLKVTLHDPATGGDIKELEKCKKAYALITSTVTF